MTEIIAQFEDWQREETLKPKKKSTEDTHAKAQAIRDASLAGLNGDDNRSISCKLINDSIMFTSIITAFLDESPSVPDDFTPKRKRVSGGSKEILDMITASEERESENKNAMIELEKRRIDLLEREVKIREENENHRREMEIRELELKEKQLKMEERRLNQEDARAKRDAEERQVLFQLLRDANSK